MQSFSVRDVERVLRLSRSTVLGLIRAGFVAPSRGARREYRFSFQDLIVLRAAKVLLEAKVSRRRIRRSLEDLRRHLPPDVPLSGLTIRAIGDRVVVREGKHHFQVDDGQYLLGLDVEVDQGVLRIVSRPQPQPPQEPGAEWFSRALGLEASDVPAALAAYERAVNEDAQYVSAWINWGRLLHEQGSLREAERVYREGVEHCGNAPLLMFNLGVLLEDLGREQEAIDAYRSALEEDPRLADGHYNLARLYQASGDARSALRHLGQYRRLMASGDAH